MNGTEDKHKQFLQDRGTEIIRFVVQFIKQNDIPDVAAGGGTTITGWSLGAPFALAAAAYADSLGEEEQSIIASHLKTVIMQR